MTEPFTESVVFPSRDLALPSALQCVSGAVLGVMLSSDLRVAASTPRPVHHLENVDQLGEEIDGRWVRHLAFHVPNHLGSSKLPLDIGLLLEPLVSITHHGDEQIDEDNDNKDIVQTKHHLCHGPNVCRPSFGKLSLICQTE